MTKGEITVPSQKEVDDLKKRITELEKAFELHNKKVNKNGLMKMTNEKPEWIRKIDRKGKKKREALSLYRGIGHYKPFIQRFHPMIFENYYFEGDTVVGEPYGIYLESLGPFSDFCRENGLSVQIKSQAKHHPNCIRIIVKKKWL